MHRLSEIQKDSQHSRAHYLHGANFLWLFVRANLACWKAGQTDRLENPQPLEYQVGVIRMPALFDWFHLHSGLTLSSLLSQQDLDLRCDSRGSRKIFSLLQVLRIN